jgi:valyl-tRNA synthetase
VLRFGLREDAQSNQCIAKKEAKRLEKLAKAAVKAVVPQAGTSARKEKKEKAAKESATATPAEQWVNTTPAGEKKGEPHKSPG